MEYTGVYRTTLEDAEKKVLKEIAQKKGMTLTGYVDHVLRESMQKESQHDSRAQRV